ncbi:MAG: hypothetical protein HRT61_22905, partial [Ekhidna sp.]|nr:hypothetical protein [Ekhidna sp.]
FAANWEPIPFADQIDIEWSDDNFVSAPIGITTAGDPSIGTASVAATLTAGTQYQYRISVTEAGMTSPYSQPRSFMIPPGNALAFDGIDDHIVAPLATTQLNDFTFSAWVKPDALPVSSSVIVYNGNSALNGFGLVLMNSGRLALLRGTIAFDEIDYTPEIGQWTHVSISFSPGGTAWTVYINGVSTPFLTTPAGYNVPSGNFLIADGAGGSDAFAGEVDEVSFWSSAQSVSTIQSGVYSSLVGNETDLTLYYRFDESTGTNLPDLAGSNDGTWTGASSGVSTPQWTTSGAMSPTLYQATQVSTGGFTANWEAIPFADQVDIEWSDDNFVSAPLGSTAAGDPSIGTASVAATLTAGTQYQYRISVTEAGGTSPYSPPRSFMIPPGNALAFDGADDFVQVQDNDDFIFGSAMTLEAWVKMEPTDLQSVIINHVDLGSPFTGFSWDIGFESDARMDLYVADASSGQWFQETTTALNDGVWHHVAVTYNGATAIFYIDGQEASQSTGSAIAIGNSVNDLYIGVAQNFGRNFEGNIDEVRMWSSVKNETQIQTSLSDPLIGNETDLVAYYRFDQTSGTLLADNAGIHDGTLFNGQTNTPAADGITEGPLWQNSQALTPVPSAPTSLVAYSLDGTNITLEWDASGVGFEDGFKVYRSADYGFAVEQEVAGLSLGADTTTVTFAEDASRRFYRVAAYNVGGESRTSSEFATTEPFPAFAGDFTDDTDRITLSTPSSFNGNLISAEAWIKTTKTSLSRVIINGDGGNQRWSLG